MPAIMTTFTVVVNGDSRSVYTIVAHLPPVSSTPFSQAVTGEARRCISSWL